ncbi:putative mediator of RNA polymerase II transcription subunit 29 isoform X1 [Calliphora vicina]|uniref:putative mediator of RNA polymerase II transcription subunit 29 isoform X1 n=1 Tax=Calliphora vicina TaxID=7373 RepID=UPI00325A70F3
MKFYHGFLAILFIMFVRCHNSQALKHKGYRDQAIRDSDDVRPNSNGDNIITGDNVRNRVQINGKTIETGTTDNESNWNNNGNRYQSRENNNDNIITGDNVRNRVQINGRTIETGTTDNESNWNNNGNRYQSRKNNNNHNGHNIKHQGRTTISQSSDNN